MSFPCVNRYFCCSLSYFEGKRILHPLDETKHFSEQSQNIANNDTHYNFYQNESETIALFL